ncbi:MAG: translocation/assembly module TamB domain-containing protein, partial [Methylococcales bacterium]|nr:translocation/assembly module TamB domain-containing protein [Methylococcales bacterium]
MTLSKLSLRDQKDQLQLNLKGDYHLGEKRFQAKGAWKRLAWPLSGDAQFSSPTGEFNAEGLISDYVFKIIADAGGSQVPKGHWNLDGKGSDQALDRFTVNGATLDGVIKANGKATWEPEVTWQIALAGEQLNPGKHWPDLPGNLTAKLKSTGKLTADGPDLSADIEQFSGKFRDQKVRGKGHIEKHGEMLDVHQLNINIGKTHLSANGQLGNRWDLNWQLASPDLSQLAPDFNGSIKVDGALTGTPTQPEGSVDLDIRKLSLGESRIKHLQGIVHVYLSGAKRSKVDLRGSGLVLGGQKWDKLKLDGSGTPKKHQLNFNLKGEPAQLEVALNGGLQEQQWVGQLTQLAIRKTEVGDWVLKKPAQIHASQSQAKAESICLSSKPTLFCLSGNWDVSSGSQGRAKIKYLEANRFKAFLPEGIKIDTTLNGDVTGSVNAKGESQAQVDLILQPGSLSLDNNGEPVNIKLGKSLLKASLQDENGSAQLTLGLGQLGEINAQAGITDWQGTQRLSGSFKTRLNDLTLISTFAPQLQSIEGNLKADLQLGGTVKTPSVLGELRLADFSAEVPEVAIHIKDTQLTVHSDGKGPLLIKGSSRSGKGTLALSGQIDPAKKSLKLNIKGENFHASNSTLADVEISPDLKLSMNSKGMRVDGKVVIPKAHINAQRASGEEGIVSTSSD